MAGQLLRASMAVAFYSLWLSAAGPAVAQQVDGAGGVAGSAAVTGGKAKSPPQAAGGAAPQANANAGLAQRVEQLEAQLVDLQVVIGTLESLARSGGPRPSPAASAPAFGGDQGRIEVLETQIRALTSQVEQLSQQVQSGAGRRSDASGSATTPQGASAGQSWAPTAGEAETARFGSTTVTSDNLDPPVVGATDPAGTVQGQQPRPGRIAAVDPAAVTNPKQAYEEAYGYLLQQDYGAAQTGFGDFLRRFPKDRLAPDALYWLGEVHYVQRNFASAAEAFDLVIASYGTSSKAPDAALKRGMALVQLGRKQEACSAWRDVVSKYPSAPVHVKSRAESERQKAGCT